MCIYKQFLQIRRIKLVETSFSHETVLGRICEMCVNYTNCIFHVN